MPHVQASLIFSTSAESMKSFIKCRPKPASQTFQASPKKSKREDGLHNASGRCPETLTVDYTKRMVWAMNALRRLSGFTALLGLALSPLEVSSGPLSRVANTTLQLPPSPPHFGYTIANAFRGVGLSQPVCIASPPGETNRLFILEKTGNIVVITNLASPTRTVFMSLPVLSDSESGLLGLAFHPGYATN